MDLRFAVDQFWDAARDEAGQVSRAFFACPDWREVFLVRVLHALDGRLREAHVA